MTCSFSYHHDIGGQSSFLQTWPIHFPRSPDILTHTHTDALFKAHRRGSNYWRGKVSLSAFSPVPSPWASTFLFSRQPSSQMESYFSALECKCIHQKWCRNWRKPHSTKKRVFSVKPCSFFLLKIRDHSHRKLNFTNDNFAKKTRQKFRVSSTM